MLPLPFSVYAPVVLEPANASRVYVNSAGTLIEALPAGAEVQPEIRSHDWKIGTWNARPFSCDPSAIGRKRAPGTARAPPRARSHRGNGYSDGARNARQSRSAVAAGRRTWTALNSRRPWAARGCCRRTIGRAQRQSGVLAVWSGNPLELRNRGSYLETGTVVCSSDSPIGCKRCC